MCRRRSAFTFPAIDERSGADPRLARKPMDTLASVPRKRDQKTVEWRRSSPIRPVVFEDPGVVVNDLFTCILNNGVVHAFARSLHAQGLFHHDLSRACFASGPDSISRCRLCSDVWLLYGGGGRPACHERLIPVTARGSDPQQFGRDRSRLYAKGHRAKTMGLLGPIPC